MLNMLCLSINKHSKLKYHMTIKKYIKKEGIKRIVLELTLEKHKSIKLAATQMGMSMKDFIDQSVKEKIENEKMT